MVSVVMEVKNAVVADAVVVDMILAVLMNLAATVLAVDVVLVTLLLIVVPVLVVLVVVVFHFCALVVERGFHPGAFPRISIGCRETFGAFHFLRSMSTSSTTGPGSTGPESILGTYND
jgi:hypothetical protein